MVAEPGKDEAAKSPARRYAWLATLVAPFLIYLILRAAAFGLPQPVAVQTALLPPSDYRPLARQLSRALLLPTQQVTPMIMETGRQAALTSPLSYEPFFIAARAAQQAGDLARSTMLLEESRRRRPSNVGTRIHLMENYVQADRPREALEELNAALQLSAEMRVALVPHMTQLMVTREGREALAAVLAREPIWREDFLGNAGGQKLAPERVLHLVQQISQRKKGRNIGPEQRFAVRTLVSNGEYRRAREFWLGTLRPVQQVENALLFDGGFDGLVALEPFGWKLPELDVGGAEIVKDQGARYLDVSYQGGRDASLAEQTLALKPGSYRLGVSARGGPSIASGGLSWLISCLPNDRPVAALKMDQPKRELPFIVPASGCEGQKLSLVAEAGDVAREVNLQIEEIGITAR